MKEQKTDSLRHQVGWECTSWKRSNKEEGQDSSMRNWNEHEYFQEFEEKLREEGTWRHGVVCPKDLCKVRPRVARVSLVNACLQEELPRSDLGWQSYEVSFGQRPRFKVSKGVLTWKLFTRQQLDQELSNFSGDMEKRSSNSARTLWAQYKDGGGPIESVHNKVRQQYSRVTGVL